MSPSRPRPKDNDVMAMHRSGSVPSRLRLLGALLSTAVTVACQSMAPGQVQVTFAADGEAPEVVLVETGKSIVVYHELSDCRYVDRDTPPDSSFPLGRRLKIDTRFTDQHGEVAVRLHFDHHVLPDMTPMRTGPDCLGELNGGGSTVLRQDLQPASFWPWKSPAGTGCIAMTQLKMEI